jgi:hypothetical protein
MERKLNRNRASGKNGVYEKVPKDAACIDRKICIGKSGYRKIRQNITHFADRVAYGPWYGHQLRGNVAKTVKFMAFNRFGRKY